MRIYLLCAIMFGAGVYFGILIAGLSAMAADREDENGEH